MSRLGGTWMRVISRVMMAGVVLGGTLVPLAAHGTTAPSGIDKIQHVLILVQENRSFDDYLGQLTYEGQPGATGERPNTSNPNPLAPNGPRIGAFHQTSYCESADLNHSWNGTHQEIDGGRMDGFTAANVDVNDPTGSRAMGYYDQTDFPYYYALYNTFAMGDRYFASAPTQTFPNRLYLLAGTSFGHIRNDLPASTTEFSQRSIFNELDENHVTWKVYAAQYPLAIAFLFAYVRNHDAANVVPYSNFAIDAANGTLPQVAFVDPIFAAPNTVENDEHPPSNVQVGEQFASSVISTLFASPDWG